MDNIRNFVQLMPNVATSGQPAKNQFKQIAEAGYVAVINLAMPDHPDSISNEGELVTTLGMNYFHMPVPFDNPKPEHIRLFCKIMEAFSEHKVWVHCMMNFRVSAFMFHYMSKVEGIREEESKSPIFNIWEPDETWKNIISLTANEIGL